jgi:hypothetical protein
MHRPKNAVYPPIQHLILHYSLIRGVGVKGVEGSNARTSVGVDAAEEKEEACRSEIPVLMFIFLQAKQKKTEKVLCTARRKITSHVAGVRFK